METLQVALACLTVLSLCINVGILAYLLGSVRRDFKDAQKECELQASRCKEIARVLETAHNSTTQAILTMGKKIDDVNHRTLATNLGIGRK